MTHLSLFPGCPRTVREKHWGGGVLRGVKMLAPLPIRQSSGYYNDYKENSNNDSNDNNNNNNHDDDKKKKKKKKKNDNNNHNHNNNHDHNHNSSHNHNNKSNSNSSSKDNDYNQHNHHNNHNSSHKHNNTNCHSLGWWTPPWLQLWLFLLLALVLLYLFYYHYCYCYYCYCYYYDYFITSIRTKSKTTGSDRFTTTNTRGITALFTANTQLQAQRLVMTEWSTGNVFQALPDLEKSSVEAFRALLFFLNMQGCLLYFQPSCSNELDWSIILFKHVWLALLALRMLVHWIPRSMRAGFCFCWPSRDPTKYFHGWISYVRSQDHQM